MAEHLGRQQQLQRSIERALENFKKIGRNNYTAAKIRSRIRALKDLWLQYQDGHVALRRTIPTANQEDLDYFKDNQFEKTEDVYLATLDHMADSLEALEPFVSPDNSMDLSRLNHGPSSGFSLSHLPPINLPPFDGSYENWEQFRDRFTALIINNKDLSDFARMHFLTSCLKGSASECIGGVQVTVENFKIAWNTLTTRYENRRRLVGVHLATLLNLSSLTRESARDLQLLRDQVNLALAALRNLSRSPEELWNDILVYIITQKLDFVTRKAWNLKASDDTELPTFQDLDQFLIVRTRALEECKLPNSSESKGNSRNISTRKVVSTNVTATSKSDCSLCHAKHFLNACPQFLSRSPTQRRKVVKGANRCLNCLSRNHAASSCPSKYSCRICQQRHHSLLHIASESSSSSRATMLAQSGPIESQSSSGPVHALLASAKTNSRARVLLATAWVTVRSSSGRSALVRALLDQGSEMTFINENLAQLLRAKRFRMPSEVTAIGGVSAGVYRYAANIIISPRESATPVFSTTALILRTLTSYTPPQLSNASALEHLTDLQWADQNPLSSEPISLIIGADLYSDLLKEGIRKGKIGEPVAQNSVLGWIISGQVASSRVFSHVASSPKSNQFVIDDATPDYLESSSLDDQLKRFWEVEEIPRRTILAPQDEQCEQHFRSTHSRGPDGRYTVRLPFKGGPPIDIGHSRCRAERMLRSLHGRFQTHPDQKAEYTQFLLEYEQCHHMREVTRPSVEDNQYIYIPHHPVIREGSKTTHLRVVFNASSSTSNGSSLNDHLLTGPKLQTNLSAIMLRWRQHRYVYTADIKQMYRQIRIDDRDLNYQRILWSSEIAANPTEYQLLTVTYGMASAPFLALRVLKQLVEDEGADFPLAVPILRDNLYVDDVLFGDSDPNRILQIRDQVCSLLRKGGFELRKWASNSVNLLANIKPEDHGLACNKLLQIDEQIKVLGICWNPSSDAFQFQVSLAPDILRTKRAILSTIAKLFDPLGWVTPAIIKAKIFMQHLWRLKLHWDEPIPPESQAQWQLIHSEFPALNGLQVDRWTGQSEDTLSSELHGFADASSVAYAAVVYLRIISRSGDVRVTLLAGKSRVAPVKPMSVPRLELSAAVLLAHLLGFVQETFGVTTLPCYCWTDSTIVLAWLHQHPSKWKTFIANRVVEVQSCLPHASWRHVSSEDNPADCASRGLLGSELTAHSLWWRGPPWLSLSESAWPLATSPPSDDGKLETTPIRAHLTASRDQWELASRYSSWTKLLRVTAYIIRFINRCRIKANNATSSFPNSIALSASEYQLARRFWLKNVQTELFPAELYALTHNQSIVSRSSILSLHPFLDNDGLIRVGGRLRDAPLSFHQRHPIILSSHPIVTLMIMEVHLQMLHAGPQLTLARLRQEVWILRARSVVRSVIYKCIPCVREKGAAPDQLMGNLPPCRVTPSYRCFLHCGLDYAGPIQVRASVGRGIKSIKAYIALFICMATKAIHLELVGNYSTQSFLDAFSRFCAHRGLPQAVYSDNGTTFTGADRELTSAYQTTMRDPKLLNFVASDNISWHFNPPSAPHFGGLWESGVRSVKHHIRRVLGSHTLTFEELTTLLCRIEACLNSRPLAPLSDSFDDVTVLTPGHFLIGSDLKVNPEPSVLDINENRLSRWQLVRRMTEHFWTLWQTDYVSSLQQRTKWKILRDPIKVGQIVLLRNANLPPCKWDLGRVTRCHPGQDGIARLVTVKTASSEYKRPIVKLCLLPIDIDNHSESESSASDAAPPKGNGAR